MLGERREGYLRVALSSAAPQFLRACRSVCRAAPGTPAAPSRAITRTVISGGPEPKDARTSGAQAVAEAAAEQPEDGRRLDHHGGLRGTREADPSTSSWPEGNPRALSAAHITRSQETGRPG